MMEVMGDFYYDEYAHEATPTPIAHESIVCVCGERVNVSVAGPHSRPDNY